MNLADDFEDMEVGDVVPGVVVWSLCVYSQGWVGKCSEILAA